MKDDLIMERDVKAYFAAQCLIRLKVKPVILGIQGNNGIPDRLVPYKHNHLVELKRPVGGKVSSVQKRIIEYCFRGDTLVWVLHDFDTVDAFINYLLAVYG